VTITPTTELLSNIMIKSGGYARANLFSVEFTPPTKLMLDSDRLQRISANCSSASIPGIFFASKDNNPGGQINREIPHTPIFQNWPISVYLSDDQMEKRFFNAWQRLVFDEDVGSLEYYDNYVGVANLKLHSKRPGDPTETMTLTEVYPKVVGDVHLSYQAMNEICVLPVVLAYRIWTPTKRSGQNY
jgi:hypothetical protein